MEWVRWQRHSDSCACAGVRDWRLGEPTDREPTRLSFYFWMFLIRLVFDELFFTFRLFLRFLLSLTSTERELLELFMTWYLIIPLPFFFLFFPFHSLKNVCLAKKRHFLENDLFCPECLSVFSHEHTYTQVFTLLPFLICNDGEKKEYELIWKCWFTKRKRRRERERRWHEFEMTQCDR